MKPIDDAMIIAAVQAVQSGDNARTILEQMAGCDYRHATAQLQQAERRGLIRYEVVPSCVEMNATFTCPDNEMRFVNAKPEDGWKAAYHELGIRIARLSVRLTRLENDNTYLADTIHDEEGEQDG